MRVSPSTFPPELGREKVDCGYLGRRFQNFWRVLQLPRLLWQTWLEPGGFACSRRKIMLNAVFVREVELNMHQRAIFVP